MDSVKFMCEQLISYDVHHELLNYEGLLAFTNLSSFDDDIRDKIVISGGWKFTRNLFTEKNNKIVTGAAELITNLSMSSKVPGIE